MDPDAIVTNIAEANAHSSEVDIERILIPHIRNYFSKSKIIFKLLNLVSFNQFFLPFLCVCKSAVLVQDKDIKIDN